MNTYANVYKAVPLIPLLEENFKEQDVEKALDALANAGYSTSFESGEAALITKEAILEVVPYRVGQYIDSVKVDLFVLGVDNIPREEERQLV